MSSPPPRASLALLQSIFDGASDAIVIVDGRGRIVLTNASAAALFGYDADEMNDMPVDLLVPDVLRSAHAEHRVQFGRHPANGAMAAGRNLSAQRKDGRLVPVDISLTRVDLAEGAFVIAIARDVAVYRRFLDVCPIAIFVSEGDGVRYANPAALALVGVADGSAFPQTRVIDLVHPEDRPAIQSWMTEAVVAAAIATRPQVEERIVRADGEVRYVETTSVVVPNTPAPTFLVAMQDVTDRRHAWERARTLEVALQQQQRLADIGAVTTRIVHDIANPIAGLIMGTERALQVIGRMPPDIATSVRPTVDRVLTTSRHLETLLREFKDFSRQQRLEVEQLLLDPFFAEITEAWSSEAAAQNVALRTACAPDLAIAGDRLKLRRVFDNLIKNALEAIAEGPGTIEIDVGPQGPGRVRIVVADSGPGIPAGMDPFTLFETTKPNGTGLGLASVRQIVEAHGGTIDFEREAGRGAVFHVALPTTTPPGS